MLSLANCVRSPRVCEQLIFRWLRVGARQKLRIQYSPSSPRLTTLAQWCSFVLPAATQVSQLPAIDDTQEEDAAGAIILLYVHRRTLQSTS